MQDDEFRASAKEARGEMLDLGARMEKIGQGASAVGGALTILGGPIAAVFGIGVKGAMEMQNAVAQTEAVIKSTGGAAGMSVDRLVEMSGALQMMTGIQDDAILSGENLLLTFTGIGKETFPRATKAMLDMSVAMKQDLKSSAIQLGKALNDPSAGLTALTRVGVVFTAQQEEMIKAMMAAGDVAGAQAVILAELEREFGGSAEAAGKTFAGQLAIAQRQLEDVQEEIGNALIPTLSDLLKQVKPVIMQVLSWVRSNPELIKGIGLIAGALTVLGPILMGAGAAISAIGTVIGVILSPIGLIIGAVVALYAAFESNFLGIRDFLQPVLDDLGKVWYTISHFAETAGDFGIGTAITAVINSILDLLGIASGEDFFEPIRNIGDQIVTVFLTVATFIQNRVLPVISDFFTFLGNAWETIRPGLEAVFNWFVNEGLPAIGNFISNVVFPGIQSFFNFIGGVWETIRPGLEAVFNWFVNEGLPAIRDFIVNEVGPRVETFFKFIGDVWTTVSTGLTILKDWFVLNGLPKIQEAVENIHKNVITPFIDLLKGIWTAVSPYVDAFKGGIEKAFNWVRDNVIQPIIDKVNEFIRTVQNILGGLGAYGGAAANASQIGAMVASGQVSSGDVVNAAVNAFRAQFGFAGGGYTGDGPSGQIAGPVHRREWVVPEDGALVLRGEGGGMNFAGATFIINANSEAEGRAAARGFKQEIGELLQASG